MRGELGSKPADGDLAAELWDELMEVRACFPAGAAHDPGGVNISGDRAERARSAIAPLVRRLRGDEAREALGEARQLAALGECFAYLHWASQAVGAPSAAFRDYADHYLTSAIPLLEDRAGDGPRGAARGRAQARQVNVGALRSLLNEGLDAPVRRTAEAEGPGPCPPTAPTPELPPSTLRAEEPSTPAGNAGEVAPAAPMRPPADPPAQDTRADGPVPASLEPGAAPAPAPATPPPPRTSRAGARGRSGAGRRPRRTGSRGTALGKYILALTGAVIAGAVVAVAVLAAARLGASLSGWPERDRTIVRAGAVLGGSIGAIVILFGAMRPGRRLRRGAPLVWGVSVIVSVIAVARVSARPSAMRLVDSGVTGLAALMSERLGRMVPEGSAAVLSATIICAVVGVVLGAAIGFAVRLILLLLSGESREGPRGPAR